MYDLNLIKASGGARFATEQEMFTAKGINRIEISRLGNPNYYISKAGFPVYSDEKVIFVNSAEGHVVTIGSTGSGKSRSFDYTTILSCALAQESFVSLQVKYSTINNLSNFLREKGFKIAILDLRNPSNSTITMDLLKGIKSATDEMRETFITDFTNRVLIPEGYVTKEMYWVDSAKNALAGLIWFMLENISVDSPYCSIRGLMELTKYAFGKETRTGSYKIKEFYSNFHEKISGSKAYAYISDLFITASDTAAGTVSTMQNALYKFFGNAKLAEILSHDSFSVKELCDTPTALFVVTPDESKNGDTIAKLLIEQIYNELTELAVSRPDDALPRRVNLLFDEYCNTRYNCVEQLSVCRSRNIRFMISIQSYAQLIMTFGKSVADTILANCDNKVFLHENENGLSEEISKLAGTAISPYTGVQYPLLSPYTLRHLPVGAAVIISGRNHPFVTRLSDFSEIANASGYKPLLTLTSMQEFDKAEYAAVKPLEPKDFKYLMSHAHLIGEHEPSTREKSGVGISPIAPSIDGTGVTRNVPKRQTYRTMEELRELDEEFSFEEIDDSIPFDTNNGLSGSEMAMLEFCRKRAYESIHAIKERNLRIKQMHHGECLNESINHYVYFYKTSEDVIRKTRLYFEKFLKDKEKAAKIVSDGHFVTLSLGMAIDVTKTLQGRGVPCDYFAVKCYCISNKSVKDEDDKE